MTNKIHLKSECQSMPPKTNDIFAFEEQGIA